MANHAWSGSFESWQESLNRDVDSDMRERGRELSDGYRAKNVDKGVFVPGADKLFQAITGASDDVASSFSNQLNNSMIESLVEKKKTEASINISPKGGISIGFSGPLENIGKIPEVGMEKLKEIKNDPVEFLKWQLVNFIGLDDVEKSVDEHRVKNDNEYAPWMKDVL